MSSKVQIPSPQVRKLDPKKREKALGACLNCPSKMNDMEVKFFDAGLNIAAMVPCRRKPCPAIFCSVSDPYVFAAQDTRQYQECRLFIKKGRNKKGNK